MSRILVERQGPVTTIVINRPQAKNALDNEAARGLRAEALRSFAADGEARVAVLTGAGGAFCAGADLKELGGGTDYFPLGPAPPMGPLHAPLAKPVIAAIEGHACAGGLGVALLSDIRLIDDSAVFGVFSRRWGVPMSDGTTVRLPRIVGQGRALDMLLTGRAVGAEEAIAMGLAHPQGSTWYDPRRGGEARLADRRLPADRHDLGPSIGLREFRPRPGRRRAARDGAVDGRPPAGIAGRRGPVLSPARAGMENSK